MAASPQQMHLDLMAAEPKAAPPIPIDGGSEFLITLRGMNCAGCAGRIETTLSALPHIQSAQVNFALGQAAIHSNTNANATFAAIQNSLRSMGYEAALAETATDITPAPIAYSDYAAASALLVIFAWDMLAGFMVWPRLPWIGMAALAVFAQFWLGRNFIRTAISALRQGQLVMDSLVALGTTAAFVLSAYLLGQGLSPQWGQENFWLLPLPHHQYFEAAVFILGFVTIGRNIEQTAQNRAKIDLMALTSLLGQEAVIMENGLPRNVPLMELKPGMIVLAAVGSRLPVDGVVTSGHSDVDHSLFTGETLPQTVAPGDRVWAGGINLGQALQIRVEKTGAQTRLGFVRDLVQFTANQKSALTAPVDRITQYFVPMILALAAMVFVFWAAWDLGHGLGIERAVLNAISVLVIACPCALGLAVPMVIINILRLSGKSGILLRDLTALENLRKINYVVLDKTGTLTMGRPELMEIIGQQMERTQLLRLAASALGQSRHPLAQAVSQQARQENLQLLPPVTTAEIPGQGVRAEFLVHKAGFGATAGDLPNKTFTLWVGNRRLLNAENFDLSPLDGVTAELAQKGHSLIFVGMGESDGQKKLLGTLALRDQLRPQSRDLVAFLHRQGIPVLLLSGDNRPMVEQVATDLGITETLADILPAEKAGRIKSLRARGKRILMLGDGLNDAPALAMADIGIAMAGGSDLAMQAAKIGFLQNNPLQIRSLFALGDIYARKVRQNLAWAFGFNILAIPAAALGLLSPGLAGLLMAVSSLLVVANASTIARINPEVLDAE